MRGLFYTTMSCVSVLAFAWISAPTTGQAQVISGGAASVIGGAGSARGGIRNDFPAAAISLHKRLRQLRGAQFAGEMSLKQLVQQLNAYGVPTVLNQRALEDEAVSIGETIEIPDANLTMDQRLDVALDDINLSWTVTAQGRAILISSRDDVEERLFNVTYDVTPIAMGDFDSIINLITSTVDPDSWDEVGGPGTIQHITVRGRGMLVFSATYRTHQKVSRLLNSLDRFGGVASIPSARSAQPHSVGGSHSISAIGSQPIVMPTRPDKRGINLPGSKSQGNMGGFGGGMMGGMGGGMF